MSRNRSADSELEASLRRIRGALQSNRNQYAAMVEQIMAAAAGEAADRVTAKIAEARQRRLDAVERASARIAERHDQRIERRLRRDARRAARREMPFGYDAADIPRAVVSAAFAVACFVLAVLQPHLWWLLFVGFGLGMSSASRLGRAARRRRMAEEEAARTDGTAAAEATAATGAAATAPEETKPAPPPEPADPKVTRIQTLCDKLLAELESGPPIVREVVSHPKETIGGLRQACLEIARRELELRTVLATQEEATLVADRDALVARLANETDEIVRDRLGQALRALEQQLAHRAELATAATRLEAENTRILYTLENLNMQLLRARSTDIGAPELGGKLRDSLRELGTEIDAVAEALEWASAPGNANKNPAAETPAPPATTGATGANTADAERAERQAAARRAEQARGAQRN